MQKKKEPVQCRCPSCAVALVESLEFSAPAARSERSIPLFKTFTDYTVEGHTTCEDFHESEGKICQCVDLQGSHRV